MKDVADCLQLLMDAEGLNPNSLAERVNSGYSEAVTSQMTIWRIIKRETKDPRDTSLKPLADYFGLTPLQMRDWDYVVRHITSRGAMDNARQNVIKEIDEMLESASEDDLEAIKRIVEKVTVKSS